MDESNKKIVKVGARLTKYIGSKATRENKMKAASMHAEFNLKETLIILCYLSRDTDREIAVQARKNLIPAARNWFARPDKPELPEPIHEIVHKVIEKVGMGDQGAGAVDQSQAVEGNIGLFGLAEIIQAVDHNNRTAAIKLARDGEQAVVYTKNGKVVGCVKGSDDGLDALYQAFGWVEAQFSYCHDQPGAFTNEIKVNTLNLVMDALEYSPDDDPFDNDASWEWSVQGHLKVMNIFEIAEIFEMNSKHAICELNSEEQQGTLYFGGGRVINASFEDMTGMDAACYLLAWPNARFVVKRGGEDVEQVIHVGMQNLIIEAMRLLDEGVTSSDKIETELAQLDELFEGQDVYTLPVLDKVRLIFGEDAKVREELEIDRNPIVRKAVKVRISKTVHKYLKASTDRNLRLNAAKARIPMSTTEKLVLLSYLSHDDDEEIKDAAKRTLEGLDIKTYRKGFDSDLHPSVTDYLVREAIKELSLIRAACATDNLLPDTALYILDHWQDEETLRSILDNFKLLERSDAVSAKVYQLAEPYPSIRHRVESFEEGLLAGDGDLKVEGYLSFCGLAGLIRAAQTGNRSVTVAVDRKQSSGRVFIMRGKVIGATWDSLTGPEAIEEILKYDDLKFRYVLRTHFHQKNLETGATDKILSNAKAGPQLFEPKEGESSFRIIAGHPESMDLFEILTALDHSVKPVRVNVVCDEGNGNIYRDRQHILHAEVRGKTDAFQAMAAMLSWTNIRFLVRDVDGECPKTIEKAVPDMFAESIPFVGDEVRKITNPGELPEWELSEEEVQGLYNKILHMGVADKIKLAFSGNKEARDLLVRDPIKMVAIAAVKSPKIQEAEIEAISKSRSVCDDVLRHIANTKEWVSSYSIKVNLCNNSKTPLPITMKLLNHLRVPELRKLAKSKNIAQAVATQARRIVEVKGDNY